MALRIRVPPARRVRTLESATPIVAVPQEDGRVVSPYAERRTYALGMSYAIFRSLRSSPWGLGTGSLTTARRHLSALHRLRLGRGATTVGSSRAGPCVIDESASQSDLTAEPVPDHECVDRICKKGRRSPAQGVTRGDSGPGRPEAPMSPISFGTYRR
jgi:hypothetical protein